MRSTVYHRQSIRRLAPIVLASVLLSISPMLTSPAYALDSISGILTAGGTLSTGADATLTDPTATSVTVPVAGLVTIAEGAVTQTAPSNREFFGQEIDITAPLALTILDPIRMVFRFDASVVPAGSTASHLRMFRNGTELPACTGAAGTASPNPCTSSISIDPTTGDLEIVALTSAASRWNAGKVKATDGGGSVTASPGSVIASSTGNTLSFAFTASSGGMDGQIQMTIPSGWSPPQSTDATGAGYVSVAPGTCTGAPDTALVSVAARVVTLDMLCAIDQTLSIGYANAAAPATFTDHEFTTKTKLDGGTFTSIAVQPKVSTAAGALSRFEVSSIGTLTAGSGSTALVTAKDALGNIITTYSGTPVVGHDLGASATGCGAGGASACNPSAGLSSFSSGQATLSATAYKAETARTITMTDGSVASSSNTFGVGPSDPTGVAITVPATATAGTPITATVTARDAYGNTATGYRGTVSFGSSDGSATLPADHTFAAGDNGTKQISATLVSAGSRTISVTDSANSFSATSGAITVAASSLNSFAISSIPSQVAGAAFTATVTARDAYGNTVTGYSGPPTVTHTLGTTSGGCGQSGGSPCSPSASLSSFSSGHATLSATAYKAETGRTITITDGSVTAASSAFAIAPAAAARLSLLAPPDAAVGSSFTATLTALDTYGNVATGYRGTVSFSSTDAYASLPAGHVFSAADSGTRGFAITFGTAGVQSVTAEDAGATLTASDSVTVSDTSVPTVTISSLSPSLVSSGGSATITWSADERGTFSVRAGGTSCSEGPVLASGSYQSGPKSTSIEASVLAEGANTVRVCVTDSGANTGEATGTVTKDSIAPDTAITSGPSGILNTSSVGFGFSSPDPDATFSCRMTDGAGSVVFTPDACTGGTKTYDVGDLPAGTYVFETAATDPAGNPDPTPATRPFTLDRSIPQSDRVVAELGAGGTVSTGTQPSASDVVVTSVRVPGAGEVTIEETAISLLGPEGWTLFGQQVNITAPAAASFDDPLRFVFRISLTVLPEGYDASEVTVFKDGSLVPSCLNSPSDPCSTTVVGTESLEITVLTTRASAWNFGVRTPSPNDVPDRSDPVAPPAPSDNQPPEVVWSQRGHYISPNGDGRRDEMTLSATFSEPTSWTLSLALQGDGIEQVAERSVSASGSGTEILAAWSELTAGREAPDGTYVWTLRGQDGAGNQFDQVSGAVVVDRTSPVISAMGIEPGTLSRKKRVTIGFAVSEAAKVRVKIFHAGSVVKRFKRRTLEEAGAFSIRWRGRDDNGRLLASGAYRVVIRAVDRGRVVTVNRSMRVYIKDRHQ